MIRGISSRKQDLQKPTDLPSENIGGFMAKGRDLRTRK